MSKMLHIEVADDVLLALQGDTDTVAYEMRVAAAVKWYETGRVSQGKAAEIAGLSRTEFIETLSRMSVSPFQESADEVAESVGDLT